MNRAYLHLGSNLKEPLKQLFIAFKNIETKLGSIVAYSKFYKTEAWGIKEQDNFINVAITIDTTLEASILMEKILCIENKMGRIREKKWAARIIDIDIIFYNTDILKLTNLNVPHPFMEMRNFVLIPLMDIAPNYVHPILKKTVTELNSQSKDSSKVILL